MTNYIGSQPTSVPLTSSDITDGIITTAKIADDAVTGAKIENNPTIAGNLAVSGTTTLSDNIVFGASSKGIHLGVTSATASNLMDDYEEGTFSSSHAGYQISNSGAYTKIGRMVHFAIDLTAHSGASSNLHFFYGLPFTASGKDCGVAMGYGSGSSIPRAYVEQSTDRVYLRNSDGTGNSNLSAGTRVGVAGTYAT